MKTFTINKKNYKAKEFDFNMVCDFEDNGIALASIGVKPTSAIRAYLAICGNMTVEMAGKELEEHIKHGGDTLSITDVLVEAVEKSDFFQALSKGQEKETQ